MTHYGKKKGTTNTGCWYSILQENNMFHISVGKGDFVIYEGFENPPSIEFLDNNILLLEQELYNRFPIGSKIDIIA
jgi:hypothetical protein